MQCNTIYITLIYYFIMSKESIINLDTLMDSWTNDMQIIACDNAFPYLFTKAVRFLEVGFDEYCNSDNFDFTVNNLNNDDKASIQEACMQITKGQGVFKENPFRQISIRGLNLFFNLMHFKSTKVKSKRIKLDEVKGFLDEVQLKHVVNEEIITYYNFV